ncbi:MAG: hypothetical protein WCE49_18545, partial [Terrimicrobiaceae bacterium]
ANRGTASESRMRETRPSGSMRGRHQTVIGHVPLIPVVSPYSTRALSVAPAGHFVFSANLSRDRGQLRQLVIDRETAATMTKCRGIGDRLSPENQAVRAANFLLIDRRRTRLAALPRVKRNFSSASATANWF